MRYLYTTEATANIGLTHAKLCQRKKQFLIRKCDSLLPYGVKQ